MARRVIRIFGAKNGARDASTRIDASWVHPIDTDPAIKHRLAICAIFKDEAPYLREWIEFHRLVGVEKFFLYDNNSSDDAADVLSPFIESGLVTLHYFPQKDAQLLCYQSCIQTYRERCRWMAFIDIDEFLFPATADSLTEVLHHYEDYPAVAVNWVMFTTSGHVLRPDSLVTETYSAAQVEGNRHVKLVVDPRRVESFTTPHSASFTGAATAVNELFQPVIGPYSTPPSLSRIRVNHYWTKSVEDFLVRRAARGTADTSDESENRDLTALLMAERQYSTGQDHTVQRFLPALKQAMYDPPNAR